MIPAMCHINRQNYHDRKIIKAVRLEGRDSSDHLVMTYIFSRVIKVFCIMTVLTVTQIFMCYNIYNNSKMPVLLYDHF